MQDTQHLIASKRYLPVYLLEQQIEPELRARVHVTHYQAGNTRATNALKHCEAIVFLGRFWIAERALTELRQLEHCATTQEDWLLAEVVQATYRTRIRLGDPVDVYFTPDFDDAFLNAFLHYVNARDAHGDVLSVLHPAAQLRQLLTPHGKLLVTFHFLATEALALLRGEEVTYEIPDEYLKPPVRPDNFKQSVQRLVAGKAVYRDQGKRRFSVQLTMRP
jgi:hypothetical protein